MGEWRYSSTIIDLAALDGGDFSASHSGCFTSGEKEPGTHWIGGWMGPQRRSRHCGVERKLALAGNRTPAVQHVAIPTEVSLGIYVK
jgi:hypothetical protein